MEKTFVVVFTTRYGGQGQLTAVVDANTSQEAFTKAQDRWIMELQKNEQYNQYEVKS